MAWLPTGSAVVPPIYALLSKIREPWRGEQSTPASSESERMGEEVWYTWDRPSQPPQIPTLGWARFQMLGIQQRTKSLPCETYNRMTEMSTEITGHHVVEVLWKNNQAELTVQPTEVLLQSQWPGVILAIRTYLSRNQKWNRSHTATNRQKCKSPGVGPGWSRAGERSMADEVRHGWESRP